MKKLINRIYNRKGFELRRMPPNAFIEQQRLLGDGSPSVIFDVGGHYGETVHEYKALFPEATIYSFEPFPESFAALEQTAAQYENVHAVQLALADQAGEAQFSANVNSATNSLLPIAAEAARTWGNLVQSKTTIRVPTVTLDEFCEARGIDAIDLLKLDVQGGEPLVLRGAERMLRRQAVRIVYAEIITVPCYAQQLELDEFLRMMREYGFALHNFFDPHSSESGRLKQCDAIFVRAGDVETRSPATKERHDQSDSIGAVSLARVRRPASIG
jgi:FkbM family methyltransferase